MSFFKEFYTYVNAQSWAPANIAFDVKPKTKDDPYYTMFVVSDPGITADMCANDSGQSIVQFDGYGTDKYSLNDIMDKLRKDVLMVRNALPTYSLWQIKTTGVVGFATEDAGVYRFTFEAQCLWGIV